MGTALKDLKNLRVKKILEKINKLEQSIKVPSFKIYQD